MSTPRDNNEPLVLDFVVDDCSTDDDETDADTAANGTAANPPIKFRCEAQKRESIFWDFAAACAAEPSLRFWSAPMVGGSELAFRMLVREHGCGVASTPMLSANALIHSAEVRAAFRRDAVDRPLVVQLQANTIESFVRAGLLVQPHCDAIELNLGCPQACASHGFFGAFLMGHQDLVCDMLATAARAWQVPVLAKIRVFADYERTLAYATRLVDAGISVLTVHGRTRREKRSALTLARWDFIAQLTRDLGDRCAIVSNGNIRCRDDALRCLRETGAVSVMSACALLANPWLFDENDPDGNYIVEDRSEHRAFNAFDKAITYLEFAERYNAPQQFVRRHVHRILPAMAARNVPELTQAIASMQKVSSDEPVPPKMFCKLKQLIEQAKQVCQTKISR